MEVYITSDTAVVESVVEVDGSVAVVELVCICPPSFSPYPNELWATDFRSKPYCGPTINGKRPYRDLTSLMVSLD